MNIRPFSPIALDEVELHSQANSSRELYKNVSAEDTSKATWADKVAAANHVAAVSSAVEVASSADNADAADSATAAAAWVTAGARSKADPARVREALLHLIRRADENGFCVTQYDILKSLFFADRSHINKYRRPITFDQYHALPDGPVPSLSHDVLKESLHAFEVVEIDEPLWTTEPAGEHAIRYFDATRDGSDEILSESDIEELDAAQDLVRSLGFGGVWEKTHADPAYKKAWEQRGTGNRFPMRHEDLLDRPDPRLISELAFVTHNA